MTDAIRFLSVALASAACFVAATVADAEVQTKEITYEQGGETLTGVLAWDDAVTGSRPGVLVVHEWWGLNDYARSRAIKLAEMGYVAFALDMFGKGKVTEHPQEAGKWASQIRENTDNWRARALAGLDVLKEQEHVNASRLAAIGYCFGGSTVLQLAYAGAPVKAVVSFHGALMPPEEGTKIAPTVLVCHGAADAFVPPASVQAFEEGMEAVNADYYLVAYGGARHAFTNPNAGHYGLDNLKYDAAADRRSWNEMQRLFQEVLKPESGQSR